MGLVHATARCSINLSLTLMLQKRCRVRVGIRRRDGSRVPGYGAVGGSWSLACADVSGLAGPLRGVHAGIIRHMRSTRDRNLLIHQSSINRIILVTLDRAETQ